MKSEIELAEKKLSRDKVVVFIAKTLLYVPLPAVLVRGAFLGVRPPMLEIFVGAGSLVAGLAIASRREAAIEASRPTVQESDEFEREWDAIYGENAAQHHQASVPVSNERSVDRKRQSIDLEARRRKRDFWLKNPEFFDRN